MEKTRRKFTAELKAQALELAETMGVTSHLFERTLGTPNPTYLDVLSRRRIPSIEAHGCEL